MEDFEAQKKRAGEKHSPVEGTDVDISIVKETEDDEIGLVKADSDLVKETGVDNSLSLLNIAINLVRETGVTIDLVRDETEVQAVSRGTETDKTESVIAETGDNKINDMAVDATESVVMSDEVQEKTIDLEKQDKETTKITKEAGPAELMTEPKSPTESTVGEYVESDSEPEMEKKSEDKPEKEEYQEELIKETKEKKDMSLKDEIKSEKTVRDLELKKEVGGTKAQPKKIVAWPKHIYSDEGNIEEVDEEDIFTWSPPPPYLPENSVLASTIPWIDVLSRSDAKRANSIEKLPLFGSDSEEEEGGKVEAIKAEFKKAYVAIRRLKLPGLRFAVKTIKQKKKKRIKQPRTKWALNPDAKDEDWTPSMTGRVPKMPAKIRLIKRSQFQTTRKMMIFGNRIISPIIFNSHRETKG